MADKLFFSVVEDYEGQISVCSFSGRNRAEEIRFAQNGSKALHFTTTDYDAARRHAERVRLRKATN